MEYILTLILSNAYIDFHKVVCDLRKAIANSVINN